MNLGIGQARASCVSFQPGAIFSVAFESFETPRVALHVIVPLVKHEGEASLCYLSRSAARLVPPFGQTLFRQSITHGGMIEAHPSGICIIEV